MRMVAADNAVNLDAPLNRGLTSWFVSAPGVPNAGSRWVNLCGKNHGTLTNMDQGSTSGWSTLKRPGGFGGLAFDGTNDYVPIGATATVANAASLSFFAWINAATVSGLGNVIWPFGGVGPAILRQNADLVVQYSGNVTITTGISANIWYHVGYTYDGVNVVTYFNGKPVTTTAKTPQTHSGTLEVGVDRNNTRYFQGLIDDVRISRIALPSSQVRDLYNASRTGYEQELNWFYPPTYYTTGATSYTLTCDTANVPVTGVDAGLRVNRLLDCQVNITSVTGIDAGLLANRLVTADVSNVPVTGINANILRGYCLTCDTANVPVTGIDAGLRANRLLTAATTNVPVTGKNATITVPGAPVVQGFLSLLDIAVTTISVSDDTITDIALSDLALTTITLGDSA